MLSGPPYPTRRHYAGKSTGRRFRQKKNTKAIGSQVTLPGIKATCNIRWKLPVTKNGIEMAAITPAVMAQLVSRRRIFIYRAQTIAIIATAISVCCLVITAKPANRNASLSLPLMRKMTQANRKAAATASNWPKTPDSNQAVGCNNHKLANNTLRRFEAGDCPV